MAYTELQDFGNTSEGVHVMFQYVAETVPIFIPMFLFTLFMVIFLGSYFAQIRLRNRGNAAASFAAAGYILVLVAGFMTLIEGLINIFTLTVCVVVAIVGSIWLLVASRD